MDRDIENFREFIEPLFKMGKRKASYIHCGLEMKQWFIDHGVPESAFRLVTDGIGCFWEAGTGLGADIE